MATPNNLTNKAAGKTDTTPAGANAENSMGTKSTLSRGQAAKSPTTILGTTHVREARLGARAFGAEKGTPDVVLKKACARFATKPVSEDAGRAVSPWAISGALAKANRLGELSKRGLLEDRRPRDEEKDAKGGVAQGGKLAREQISMKLMSDRGGEIDLAFREAVTDPINGIGALQKLGVQTPTAAAFQVALIRAADKDNAAVSRVRPEQQTVIETAYALYAKQGGKLATGIASNGAGIARPVVGFAWTDPKSQATQVVGVNIKGRNAEAVTAGVVVISEDAETGRPVESNEALASVPLNEWLVGKGVPLEVAETFKGSTFSLEALAKLQGAGIKPLHAAVYAEDLLPEAFLGSDRIYGATMVGKACVAAKPQVATYLKAHEKVVKALETKIRAEAAKPVVVKGKAPRTLTEDQISAQIERVVKKFYIERGISIGALVVAYAAYRSAFQETKESMKGSVFMTSVEPALGQALVAAGHEPMLRQKLPGEKKTIGQTIDNLFGQEAEKPYKKAQVIPDLRDESGHFLLGDPRARVVSELSPQRQAAAREAMAMGDTLDTLVHCYGLTLPSPRSGDKAGAEEKLESFRRLLEPLLGEGAQAKRVQALLANRPVANVQDTVLEALNANGYGKFLAAKPPNTDVTHAEVLQMTLGSAQTDAEYALRTPPELRGPGGDLLLGAEINELDGVRQHLACGVLAMREAMVYLAKAHQTLQGDSRNIREASRRFHDDVLEPALGHEAQVKAVQEGLEQVYTLDRANEDLDLAIRQVLVDSLAQVAQLDSEAQKAMGSADKGVHDGNLALVAYRFGVALGTAQESEDMANTPKEVREAIQRFDELVPKLLERDRSGNFTHPLFKVVLDPATDPLALVRKLFPGKDETTRAQQARALGAIMRMREGYGLVGDILQAQRTLHNDFGDVARFLRHFGKVEGANNPFSHGRGQFPAVMSFPELTGRLANPEAPEIRIVIPVAGHQRGARFNVVDFGRGIEGEIQPLAVQEMSREEVNAAEVDGNSFNALVIESRRMFSPDIKDEITDPVARKQIADTQVIQAAIATVGVLSMNKDDIGALPGYLRGVNVRSSGAILEAIGLSVAGSFKLDNTEFNPKSSGRSSPWTRYNEHERRPLRTDHFTITEIDARGGMGRTHYFEASDKGIDDLGAWMDDRAAKAKFNPTQMRDFEAKRATYLGGLRQMVQEINEKLETGEPFRAVSWLPAGAGGKYGTIMKVIDPKAGNAAMTAAIGQIDWLRTCGAHVEPIILQDTSEAVGNA